jgi:hypothetical protein
MPETPNNWKTKVLVGGALIGALIGLGTGYLLTRTAEESGNGPPEFKTTDGVRLAISTIGLVRGIVALGERKK